MSARDPDLIRLVKALRGPGLAPHLKSHISTTGRYLAFVEDEPMMWTQRFDERDAAIEAMRWSVSQRMHFNGAGCGAVFDLETDEVVATEDTPMPTGEDLARAVSFIREKARRVS